MFLSTFSTPVPLSILLCFPRTEANVPDKKKYPNLLPLFFHESPAKKQAWEGHDLEINASVPGGICAGG